MNCIIIEDEDYATAYLEKQLKECGRDINIQARLDTIEDAVKWLSANQTDLIFMDIQLGDGLSFEIFDHVQIKTPIIFTTSYEQYIVKSFEQNSLSYLLKPIKKSDLQHALDKYNFLYADEAPVNNKVVPLNKHYQERFIVQSGSVAQPLMIKDIAYFRLQNKRYLFLITKNNKQFIYDSTLEMLEQRLDPKSFFRINRQFIIHIDSIKQMNNLDRGRVKLITDPESKEEMIVSISRSHTFKNWISSKTTN